MKKFNVGMSGIDTAMGLASVLTASEPSLIAVVDISSLLRVSPRPVLKSFYSTFT